MGDTKEQLKELTEEEVKTLREAFNVFDLNKDGTIDGAELGVILRCVDANIVKKDVQKLIKEACGNGDGVVDFDNFVKMVQRTRHAFVVFDIEKCRERIMQIRGGASFNGAIRKHFPGALPESEYAKAVYNAAQALGFDQENTIAAISTCRDEVCKPLLETMEKTWGEAFDLTSLAGMVFLGTTGLTAALHHAPEVNGRERYFFMACPHIAIDSFGEIGAIYRPGRIKRSNACGALGAFLGEIESGHVKTGLDMDDIEYTLMKQRLLDHIPYGSKPDLVAITKAAMEVIQKDLERLISKKVDTHHADYIVAIGIQVHGPHWMNKRADMDYVYNHSLYAVIEGKRIDMKLELNTQEKAKAEAAIAKKDVIVKSETPTNEEKKEEVSVIKRENVEDSSNDGGGGWFCCPRRSRSIPAKTSPSREFSLNVQTLIQKGFEKLDKKKEHWIPRDDAVAFLTHVATKLSTPQTKLQGIIKSLPAHIKLSAWQELFHHLDATDEALETTLTEYLAQ